MTTNLSTLPNSSQVPGAAVPDGVPDAALLERIANELFAALPGSSAVPISGSRPATGLSPGAADADPARAALPVPVGSGPNPNLAFIGQPVSANDVPTSLAPGLGNLGQPDLYGFDPRLSSIVPTAISAAAPRAVPGRSSPPGAHLGSTPPATPVREVGALPEAAWVPPASAFDLPSEAELRSLGSLTRTDPGLSAGRQLPTADNPAQPYYFLDGAAPVIPPQARPVAVPTSTVDFDPLPALTPLADLGGHPAIPQSRASGQSPATEATGAPVTALGEVGSGTFYFLDESRAFADAPAVEVAEAAKVDEAAHVPGHPPFDVNLIRKDFPILQETVNGKPLIWLDNAATTQKPQAVMDRLSYFYSHENSNIHRAAHELAARATDAYEAAREKVARFLHAGSDEEIVFVRGTTEGINLIAQSWGRRHIQAGDEIVISWLEHHANIVPWQQLCQETGARLRVAPVDNDGQILLDEYEKLLGSKTKLVAFSQVSNALGTVTPAQEMIEIAHRYGAKVLLDGAQAVSHMPVDVQWLDCDWYVFSGHKVFGPTGIGAVFGKADLLNAMPPWQGGGNMIADVTFEKTIYQPAPARFEAGTGNIADAVGLGAALDYVERIGMENIARYEHYLLVYGTQALSRVPGLKLIGTAPEKAGVLSFVLDGFRSEEVGEALNREGIAVRSGHHCAQPILRRFGLETTVRPSLAFYNTCAEIDALVAALLRIQSGFYGLQR